MTYKNIATVNIALQNASLTARGFGTPIFISTHSYFPERVRTYSSLVEAAIDLPINSNAYKALESGFGNTPRPSFIKVGRREGDLELTVATGATAASVTVSVYDDGDLYTVAAEGTGADEDAVATSLVSAIEGNTDIAALTNITVSNNVIDIEGVGGAVVTIKSLSDTLSDSYSSPETATAALAAIEAEDSDFYFVAADDHTETFVLAMADAIEAKEKMYFVSTYESTTMTPYVEGSSSDIAGKLRTEKYFRTKAYHHQEADTKFPEVGYIGYNAGFVAGSVSWSNLVVNNSASTSPLTGLKLSSTEKGYLEDRNTAYVESLGSSVLRNGKVASGESIDVIRGRDNLNYDMTTELTRLLISQQGSKIPYNDEGIFTIKSAVTNVLDRYVTRNFIEPNYTTNFPLESQVSPSDKSNRVYSQGTWSAELTGAIEIVDSIQGILSIDLS